MTHRWHDTLHALEMQLLDPVVRSDPERLSRLLRDDFIEFGSSGRVYEKSALIDMITHEHHARVVIRDFTVRELAGDTALVAYRSVGGSGQEARRSSVWVNESGVWQMVFHQGTRIPNTWGPVGGT
ncbi:MAG: DUF4440 domain-containing protein [Actinobacteria bacterium]|nr:DUF4440 domain-containing protein [Actinomycetota bacterium]MCI0545297.1 DUF4440 domain-containing protein [Actinomycetota bacterium]